MAGKPTSRWGFLQQAVASVESRLDNILAEENEQPGARRNTPSVQPNRDQAPSIRISSDLSRTNSNSSASNDRLQERLAKAMAKKAASRAESPAANLDTGTLSNSKEDTIASIAADAERDQDLAMGLAPSEAITPNLDDNNEDAEVTEVAAATPGTPQTMAVDIVDQTRSKMLDATAPTPQGPDASAPAAITTEDRQVPISKRSSDTQRSSEDVSTKPSADQINVLSEVQEEINDYIERIDTLQSKLQYLTKEAAASAKAGALTAETGSLEKKLFEKDEKIALLLEEGERLTKTEMRNLAIIKKFRVKHLADNKEHESAKSRAEKAEGALKRMEDRARKAETATKQAEQALAATSASTSDLAAMRKERDALHATLADIKSQLLKANSRAELAESRARSEQLQKERKKVDELQDDLTSAKVEREISEEKLRREIKDLQAGLQREKEQARAMESDMLNEQAALESKLEAFRVRAEEATSADHGHLQAKLLRQIETLQSQYATASQNWQGIESSLLGRITNLEKERDEVVGRETEIRKKLRDTTLRAKHTERDFEALQNEHADVVKTAADNDTEIQRLMRKSTQLEADLADAHRDLEDYKANTEREMQRKLDEEKSKWTASLHLQRNESPGTSIRKNGSNITLDLNHLMSPIQYDRGGSRRPSVMHVFDSNTPPRQQSAASSRGVTNGSIAETPTGVNSLDADDYFANVPPTPLSASHYSHRGLNDLVSNSTVAAGPSVQLVERMSANVRRLESEKAASKDELSRITGQRDEARREVVNLMREVEEKRKVEDRLETIERQHQDLSQRHQTTLEILGEKSELVSELKADIVDVKQMYRQLADTMK